MFEHGKTRAMAAALLLMAVMILTTACASPADLSGDYEAPDQQTDMPTSLLLKDNGVAYLDGVSGLWNANTRGQLKLSCQGVKSSYTWEQDGLWLILTDKQGAQARYMNAAAFTSEEGAEAMAGWWCDDLGQLLLQLNGDGTGLLIETESATETVLRWQAREGMLRLEYDDPDGLTYEYLSYSFTGTQLRFCSYANELGTDADVVMSALAEEPVYDGQYRFMAVSTEESEMPQLLALNSDGTLMLDDTPGEWTVYGNGITVFHAGGMYIPMIVGDDGETLLTLETLSNSCILWAREDTFAPDDALAQRLVNDWRDDDGNSLKLSADGSVSVDWQDLVMDGTASVSPGLIRVTGGGTVQYIRYHLEEEGVRLAWGIDALDDSGNWPLFIAQNHDDQ